MSRNKNKTPKPVIVKPLSVVDKNVIAGSPGTTNRPVTTGRSTYVAPKYPSYIAQVPQVPQEECWETDIQIIPSCGTINSTATITIDVLAMAKINALMDHYKSIEWLAYLIGEDNHISDIIIPKQEVTATRVDVAPEGVDVTTIGVIHSHHDMGNQFSHTDDTYINQNHNLSLCVSHKGINGQKRESTACGKFVMVNIKIVQILPEFDSKTFIEDAVKLIKERRYTHNHYNIYNHGLGRPANPYPHGVNHNVSTGGAHPNSAGVVGAESNSFSANTVGVINLSGLLVYELENSPEDFDLMDMVALKEIVQVCLVKEGDIDMFMSIQADLMNSNEFSYDKQYNICVPLEFLDELDSSFNELTDQERVSLGKVLKILSDVISDCERDMIESGLMGDITQEVGFGLGGDEDTSDELIEVGEQSQEGCWEASGLHETSEKVADTEAVDEITPEDDIWNTKKTKQSDQITH